MKNKKFKCEKCGKVYKNRHSLLTHKYKCVLDKKFKCDICGKQYASRQNLWRHKQNHKQEIYTCDICKQVYNNKYLLNQHMYRFHKHKELYNITYYEKHYQKLKKNFVPKEHNGKMYYTLSSYITSLENKIKCEYCGKQFARVGKYYIHLINAHGIVAGCDIDNKNDKVIKNKQICETNRQICSECGEHIYRKKSFFTDTHDGVICLNCKKKHLTNDSK